MIIYNSCLRIIIQNKFYKWKFITKIRYTINKNEENKLFISNSVKYSKPKSLFTSNLKNSSDDIPKLAIYNKKKIKESSLAKRNNSDITIDKQCSIFSGISNIVVVNKAEEFSLVPNKINLHDRLHKVLLKI